MGRLVGIPRDIGEVLLARHGEMAYIIGKADWEKLRELGKAHPMLGNKLRELEVKLSPVAIRHNEICGWPQENRTRNSLAEKSGRKGKRQ